MADLIPIQDDFVARLQGIHGQAAVTWAAGLPRRIADYARYWQLGDVGPAFPASYNFVLPAVRKDGTPVALKLGFPNEELLQEIRALEAYGGRGACHLLESDPTAGVFLTELLDPGTRLTEVYDSGDDDKATEITADVMRQLWIPLPPDNPFPTLSRWFEGFVRLRERHSGGTGPFPVALVAQAETYLAELVPTQGTLVLLHGDLHHENILRDGMGWRAIDPKGVIGDPACECFALLANPLPHHDPDPVRCLSRRLDILASELGLERERIRRWALTQAVLSAVWTDSDHGTAWRDYSLALAQWLANCDQ